MNQQSFWNRRIPTFFGFIILLIGVGISAFLVQQGVIFQGLASPGNTPSDVSIANITESSFTISYLTTERVFGSLTVAENKKGASEQVIIDDRDQRNGSPREYASHVITVKNLRPQTSYRFVINSGGRTFNTAENTPSFLVTTAAKLPPSKLVYQISGKVVAADGNPATEGILYLTTDNSQVLSTHINQDGSYTLHLANLRTKTLATFLSLTPESPLSIQVKNTTGTAVAKILLKNANPVPLMTLTKTYDFTHTSDPFSTTTSSDIEEVKDFPIVNEQETSTGTKDVAITTPKTEQNLSDRRPVFKGTTAPNTEVEITISGEEDMQSNVISDKRGNWSYRPKTPLTPGEQKLTIKSQDEFGIAKTLSQEFTILAEGSQFTEPSVAPQSPTPTKRTTPTPTKAKSTPTRTPTRSTPTPTRRPTVSQPTPTPTRVATATPTPIVTTPPVTISPTPTGTFVTTIPITTTPQPSLPPTGSVSGIMYVIIGAVTVGIGLLLFFMSFGGLPL